MEDNELIALLDRKFSEADQRTEARFAQMDGRFDQVERRLDQMDGRFDQVEARFDQVDRQFDQVDARFGDVDTRFRETGIQLEHMHDLIKKTAEGVQNVDEKLDRFHLETLDELKDIRADLHISFHLLNMRITDLENSRS